MHVSYFNAGSVDIHLYVNTTTNKIQLHIRQMIIDHSSIYVLKAGGGEVEVDRDNIRELPAPLEFLIIPFMSDVEAGSTINVYIEFTGVVKKDLTGIYYSSYLNEDGEIV